MSLKPARLVLFLFSQTSLVNCSLCESNLWLTQQLMVCVYSLFSLFNLKWNKITWHQVKRERGRSRSDHTTGQRSWEKPCTTSTAAARQPQQYTAPTPEVWGVLQPTCWLLWCCCFVCSTEPRLYTVVHKRAISALECLHLCSYCEIPAAGDGFTAAPRSAA